MPSSMRRTPCSIFSARPGCIVRTIPLSTALPAMMLRAVPACSSPTVSTAGETGFTSRLTIVCSCDTSCAAAASASMPRCGWAPWPSRPFGCGVERLGRGLPPLGCVAPLARLHRRPVVVAEHEIHLRVVEHAVGDHRLRARERLLGRLEDQLHPPGELAPHFGERRR